MKTNALQNTASIVPDISLMKKMASINGTILSRIMELVDNSIDAKMENTPLAISIRINKKADSASITVKDNGCGMNEEQAGRFFRLGDSGKTNGKKIGRFGLGAKVAILGLGNKATVQTTMKGESRGVEIRFDIEAFKDWEIDYTIKKRKPEEHGTTIKIDNITVRLGDIQKLENKISEQIGKTYKHFIEKDDVVITINGKKVKPHSVELLDDYYQEFDFKVGNKRVYGWAGAMKKAGKNWKFGFDLISNKRIIKSNDFLTRQAHTSLARLTGEIFLDDFETDVHKTDFLRDTEAFQDMQTYLIDEVLDDLMAKVSQLTNKEVFLKYEDNMQHLSKVLNRVIRNGDFFQYLELNEEIFGFLAKAKRKKKDANNVIRLAFEATPTQEEEKKKKKESRKKSSNIGFVVEEPVFVSMGQDSDSKRWETEQRPDGLHLKIEINLDHATYQAESEAEAFIKNAIINSIAEFIVKEEEKYESSFEDPIERLNTIKDTIVRYSFAH